MAFDPKPSTWLPNWSEDGTLITVPIATFPQLTAAEADATTGDVRKVLFAILEQLYAKWIGVAEADRPKKLVMLKTSGLNQSTNQIVNTYTFTIVTDVGTPEVAAES